MTTTTAKIGLAVAGGYVLGRTKKAKLALGLGMFLAGKKLRLDPESLKKILANSPVLGELNSQVRDEVLGATTSAAKSALTKRVGSLADSLHDRTASLGRGGGGGDEASGDDEPADGGDGSADESQRAGSGDGAASKARKSAPAKRASSGRTAAKSAAKPAAKPAGKSAGGARKKAAGSARKSAGTARKTATRSARGAGQGGGDRG